jgi:hypothetical protein
VVVVVVDMVGEVEAVEEVEAEEEVGEEAAAEMAIVERVRGVG